MLVAQVASETSAFNAGVITAIVLGAIALYLYISTTLFLVARKFGAEPAWLAFIPIGNFFVMFKCAGYGGGWFLLMLIPVVEIVCRVIVWMKMAEGLGKKPAVLYGILVLFPIADLVVYGILAFDRSRPVAARPSDAASPA